MDIALVILDAISEQESIPDEHQFVFNNIKMDNQYQGVISFNTISPKGFYKLVVEFDIGKGILNVNRIVV